MEPKGSLPSSQEPAKSEAGLLWLQVASPLRPDLKLEDNFLSVVGDCLLNILSSSHAMMILLIRDLRF
jgi:hypothetical protein